MSPKLGVYQILAILICAALGLCMIVNTQMGGEGNWFWHSVLFNQGVHLYSDLHSPLQPLFVLETGLWIRLFGIKTIATQSLSVLHLLLLVSGFVLLVRRSSWPDWQKSILLITTFGLTVYGRAYRFDDYHSLAEVLIVFAFLLTLELTQAHTPQEEFLIVGLAGLLCGLSVVTRVTDGVALTGSIAFCLVAIATRNRIFLLALFFGIAGLTVLGVVHLTGDPFSLYLQSTVFKAAASKGGTGSILSAPLRTVRALPSFIVYKTIIGNVAVVAMALLFLVCRQFFPKLRRWLPVMSLFVPVCCYLALHRGRHDFIRGGFVDHLVVFFITLIYLVCALVALRLLLSRTRLVNWHSYEVLYFVPLAIWLSYAAGAAGQVLGSFYLPLSLMFILFAIFQPIPFRNPWGETGFLSVLVTLGCAVLVSQVLLPYSWQYYRSPAMFVGRQWYHHPVYGWLYIDREELAVNRRFCNEIAANSKDKPELLSLPYPYANFFCALPPWHNYVQTFFDTSTRPVIEGLEKELETNPPEWILYQRQLLILNGDEHWYNHDRPIPHRDLDVEIMSKLQSGQWQLVEYSNWLTDPRFGFNADGWYLIHTRP